MIIRCSRCGKEIDTPNASNADYVMATKPDGSDGTHINCPKCYRKTDIVIWGVHKKRK